MSIDPAPARSAGTDDPTGASARPRGRGGPPLPAPIAAYAALTVAAALTYPAVRPGTDPAATRDLLAGSATLATVSAMLLLASAAPLAVWTAAVAHRLQKLGARVAGPLIALVGGVLTAGALLVSAMVGATAVSMVGAGDAPLVRGLATLSYVAGGPAFALGSALLLAGVAVPAHVLRLAPRAATVPGLVIAVLGALAPLVLLVPVLGPILPVVRFGGLLWLIAMSVLLPVHRRA